MQGIEDRTVFKYSQVLWNDLTDEDHYPMNGGLEDIFACLDSDTTEDVIAIYLLENGWVIIPSSRQPTSMSWEFVGINRRPPHRRIVVSVKTGDTPISIDECAEKLQTGEDAYLFQAHSHYVGKSRAGVVALEPDEIKEFMYKNRPIMPGVVNKWMDAIDTRDAL